MQNDTLEVKSGRWEYYEGYDHKYPNGDFAALLGRLWHFLTAPLHRSTRR